MLAIRSGRYEDVQAMLAFCDMDFKKHEGISAWEVAQVIGDP